MRLRLDEREAIAERTLDVALIRRDRQNLLHRDTDPLVLHALIDESVLRRMVGGPKTMASQLDHLLAMAKRPNVTIQVIPYRAGSYGTMGSPLIIMSFPRRTSRMPPSSTA
jgi:hypothetical protein